jgi:peptide/nickel transport system substrate-binding protein
LLKGYRGPVLALIFSVALLAAVLLTRPPEPERRDETVSTVTPTQAVVLPTSTPAPTLTPAPTVPFKALDTATLSEALVAPDCVLKLNPLLAGYNQADRDLSALIFEGLMTTDPYGAAIPDLAAETPRVSTDGLVYVVKLRTDVQWQDGTPFTSADVAYTLSLLQDPAFPGQNDLYYFWRTVEFDVIDAQTVRFKLAQPLAAFPDYLRIGILPEHVLRGTNAATLLSHPFNLAPVGTGPYQFDGLIGDGEHLRGVRLRLSATYITRPEGKDGFSFRQIISRCYPTWNDAVAAFQRSEVNSIGELPAEAIQQVRGLPLTLHLSYRPALGAVIYNWANDQVNFLRDPRMRQALARSVDRRSLVDRFMEDRAVTADSPILPLSWAYAPGTNCPIFDPAKPDAAKEALARVQVTPPPTAAPPDYTPEPNAPTPQLGSGVYTFQLLVTSDAALAGMAQEIVNAWNELGLKVELVVVEKQTFRERLIAGSFDAALVELNMAPSADPDPYTLWRQSPADGGLNFGGLNERRLSEILESARRAANGGFRVDLYREFQQLFCDRASALLLYYPVYYYATDQRIAGVQLGFMADPSDRFRTIREWRFIQ